MMGKMTGLRGDWRHPLSCRFAEASSRWDRFGFFVANIAARTANKGSL